MLHTTYRLAKAAVACVPEMRKVSRALGGVKSYGPDTPILLSVVLAHTSLESALWALRCVLPGEEAERDRIARLFACDCAERVLPLFEEKYPGDDRPRRAIETARRFAAGGTAREEMDAAGAALAAAGAAAWAAVWAAVWDVWDAAACAAKAAAWAAAGGAALAAAGAAAWAAAEDAECAEQTRIFLGYLGVAAAPEEPREGVRP